MKYLAYNSLFPFMFNEWTDNKGNAKYLSENLVKEANDTYVLKRLLMTQKDPF